MTRRVNNYVLMSALMASALLSACQKQPPMDTGSSLPVADTTLVASLERGLCRGSCPAYRVEIFGDGNVRFDGQRNVASLGKHAGTTTQKVVGQLRKAIAESEAAGADSAYVMGSKGCGPYYTDLPVSTLTVRVGARLKTIQHDPGCRNAPTFLKTLEAQVDSAARSAAWISGNGDKTK